MSAYIFLAGSIFILWCITKGGNIVCKLSHARNEKWNLFLSLSFFASFLLMAVRGISVGADTISYVKYYDCMRDLDWSELFTGGWNYHFFTTEKGFMILEKICNDLEIPTQMFLAICAAIFIFGVYKLAENYIGEYKLVAVYAFLALGGYLMAMNVMRQGIGVGICCLAWHELQKGKILKFLLGVLLASTFHISCLVFLCALLFKRIPVSKKMAFLSLAGTLAFSISGASILPLFLQWVLPLYAARYGIGRWNISEANGIMIVWIVLITMLIMEIFLKNWEDRSNHIDVELMLFSLCYVGINIVGLSFDGAQRLAFLFQPYIVLFFARSCNLWKGKFKNVYATGVVLGMIGLFFMASSTAQYVYIPFWG